MQNNQPGFVRIIAGKWRSRRLQVAAVEGLRPTPDRVRETLFNWLAPYITGANCLDLFAGTGALGFEALSRGALNVTFIDSSPKVVEILRQEFVKLGGENADIYQAKFPQGLHQPKKPFDIVFLDPPYQLDLIKPGCQFLEEHEFLAATAYIYLEARAPIHDNDLPSCWRLLKQERAGQVYYHLALRELKNNGKQI